MARILVIDDENDVRGTIRAILEQTGYEVVEASNGYEGIKLYQREPVDLVITDLFMPEKEGIETIMELRRHSPNVKIIAISGGSQRWNLKCLPVAKKLGAVRTVAKPFGMDEILRVVKEELEDSETAG